MVSGPVLATAIAGLVPVSGVNGFILYHNVYMQPIFAKVIAPLLDALPDAILLVDEGGLILFANRAVRSLLGYEPPELVDQPLSVLLPVRSRELHERLMASFWLEPRSRPMTSRPFLHALSKAGVEVPVTISLAPVILSGQRRCVAALRDASLIQRQITTTPGNEGIRQ
jgi:PAS domain S-box-containing protein